MMRTGRGLASLAVAALVAALPMTGGSASGAKLTERATLRVGHEVLHRCRGGWCGRLRVPLDYGLKGSPTISVAFEWYPATDTAAKALGTLVPVEGGPGYPSIGSVLGGYSSMYGPLLSRRNLLAVDLRGTGASTPIDCPALQDYDGSASGSTATVRFERVVADCAAALNHRWRAPSGAYIHASDLFTSATAAHDLAVVVKALEVGRVDLYGDSYGSWFAQVFASHYPGLIRTVTLDSTYAVQHLDPWYSSTVTSMPKDFDLACRRSPACAAAEPVAAWRRIVQLADRLKAHRISGVVPGPTGADERVEMGVVGLVDVMNDAAGDPSIYAQLDAAARALLLDHAAAPLLRLYAQRLAYDEEYFGVPVSDYSGGLYFAVSCLDYPQLFDMHSSPSVRRSQLAAAERKLPARTFAPFSTAEWLDQDQYTEAYTGCLDWPAPTIADPPVGPRGLRLPARIPVLILGGEFDTWTPPAGVPQVVRQIGGHSRVVIMANSTHVVGEGESTGCAVSVLRAFVRDPARLDRIHTSCAGQVAPIRSVGVYASDMGQSTPVHPTGAGTTDLAARREAGAVVATAGDAVLVYTSTGIAPDAGLYGGTITATRAGLALHDDQLVPGVAVSGDLTIGASAVSGTLVVPGAKGHVVALALSWPLGGKDARATVSGHVGLRAVDGWTAAP